MLGLQADPSEVNADTVTSSTHVSNQPWRTELFNSPVLGWGGKTRSMQWQVHSSQSFSKLGHVTSPDPDREQVQMVKVVVKRIQGTAERENQGVTDREEEVPLRTRVPDVTNPQGDPVTSHDNGHG